MQISDPEEVEGVLAFFRKHIDKELDISISVFEGLTQYERLQVAEVGDLGSSKVLLISGPSQRRIEIDLHHYSFVTVSPDRKKLEIGRLLGGSTIMRITASEIA
jgi:hypothetical protein